MRRRWAALVVAVVVALSIGLVACGGGGTKRSSGDPPQNSPLRQPRGSSVGNGLSTTPPAIDPDVRSAAAEAGCSVRAFPAEATQVVQSGPFQGTLHVEGEPTYHQSIPPASGLHNQVWADWGYYDTFVPYRFQVHDLEHGGIVIHYGKGLSAASRDQLKALWQEATPYVIVVPDTSPSFPAKGVVVTSWQRWMVCKPFSSKSLAAIRVYRDTYRGTGPESVPAINSGASAPGLPKPAVADQGAIPKS